MSKKLTFTYYLHEVSSSGELASYLEGKGLDSRLAEKIANSRPFYEVTLECEVDTETGEVTLLRATL